jgi:hypothetical protein
MDTPGKPLRLLMSSADGHQDVACGAASSATGKTRKELEIDDADRTSPSDTGPRHGAAE